MAAMHGTIGRVTADDQWAPGQRDFADAERLLAAIDSAETGTAAIGAALRAQAHATLALTAVTARQGMKNMPSPEFHSWGRFLAERPHQRE